MATRPTIVVVGAGVAGLSAAVHSAWRGAHVTVLDPLGPGGQLQNAGEIETVPGLPATTGPGLIGEIVRQFGDLGIDSEFGAATDIRPDGEGFTVTTDGGAVLRADAVVIATGAKSRAVGVPGEAELEHRGVSHCAACDGPLYKDKPVMVVGGGDAAADAALALARVCSKVTLVHRRGALRAAHILATRVAATPNIECWWHTEVASINGDRMVTSVTVRPTSGGAERSVDVSGVFTAVGIAIDNSAFGNVIDVDHDGRIVVDGKLATSLPGIFAAGSARSGSSDQLASALGDGVAAAVSADRWLRGESGHPAAVTTRDGAAASSALSGSSFASYDAFYDHAVDSGLSDGLPLVPLTERRLERFLSSITIGADEPLGTLPDGSIVTCQEALRYAVIAGCRPEYAPLAVASVQAFLADIDTRRELLADSIQAVVVNGPERLRVNLNCSDGILGPGWRANATLGRALRLFITNTNALPQSTGFADPGQYTLCFGEDEEKSPWTPLHVQRGLDPAESGVTVFSARAYRQVMDRAHNDAAGIVGFISLFLRGRASGTRLFNDRPLSLMIVVGQELRRLLTPDYTKDRLRDELFTRATADDGSPFAPLNIASIDDLLIVASGGVAFPTVWVFSAPVPPPPTILVPHL